MSSSVSETSICLESSSNRPRGDLTRERIAKWGARLGVFLAGQTLVQAIGLVTGFLLVRWLSIEAYAQFSIAFGFQSTVGILVDLGFCGSIVAVAGASGKDPKVLGQCIAAAKYFRRLTMLVMLPAAVIVFPLVTQQHGWGWGLQLALLLSVLMSVVAQSYLSLYSAPLTTNFAIGASYREAAKASGFRLVTTILLHLTTLLNGVTASLATAIAIGVNAACVRRKGLSFVEQPREVDLHVRKRMIGYVLPLLPATVFAAFHSQITLFLITMFGPAEGIAEVAALGRLGQMMVVLGALNSVLVSPYVAMLAPELVVRRYFQILAVAALIGVFVVATAFMIPSALLWVLGGKYAHLGNELGWSMGSWAVSYFGSVMWTFHGSRRWIYTWHTWLTVTGQVFAMFLLAQWMNLTTSLGVIQFSLIVSAVAALLSCVAGVYGMSELKNNSVDSRGD